jgi:glycosyltransferase involved in cell wall biosynthesis
MNILMLSTYNHGGAAVACIRLMEALQQNGFKADLLTAADAGNRWPFYAERLSFLPYERDKSVRFSFSLANFGKDLTNHPLVREADVINMHWINQGFLSLEGIRALASLGKPVIWTLQDMWPFTGGCHYTRGCQHFQNNCGLCPFLKNPAEQDLSYRILERKRRLLPSSIQFVTTSRWLGEVAQTSGLLQQSKVLSIPIPVDTDRFKPVDELERKSFRENLQIAPDAHILLFVAMKVSEGRKGFAYLEEALQKLKMLRPGLPLEVVVLGKAEPEAMAGIPYRVHLLGMVREQAQIARAYGCADVFVIPSLEDNLPNTVLESLACGTPVVGFNTGGIPEMVEDRKEGFIAAQGDSDGLVEGMLWVLEKTADKAALRTASRAKILQSYSNSRVAMEYSALYDNMLTR